MMVSALKTSAIILRVADFLKGFPPFSYLPDEALLELARSGRVQFSEKGEILFDQGSTHGRYFYVINKGSVRLVRGETQKLSDLRGPGDFVGAGAVLGEATHTDSALVDEDSILYALDASVFTRLCAESPRVSRFLKVYFASEEVETGTAHHQGPSGWRGGTEEHLARLKAGMIAGPATQTVREAAAAMSAADSPVFLVVGTDGQPAGVLTDTDLRHEIATGRVPTEAAVGEIMRRPVITVSPQATPQDALLAMIRHGIRHLCVTEDGTPHSRAWGMISERSVSLSQRRDPLALVQEIRRADSPSSLRAMGEELDLLLAGALPSPDDVPWCTHLAAETRRAMFRRAEFWAREKAGPAPGSFALVLTGQAGRGEMLTATSMAAAGLTSDDEKTRAWTQDLLGRIDEWLAAAGFPPATAPDAEEAGARCRTAGEWCEFFHSLVRDPMGGEIWKQMALFDLSVVAGDPALLETVFTALREEMAARPNFIRLLANDALGNLPPVTIYEGYAVEADGLARETIDLQDHALGPVSDVARVFHLDGGDLRTTGTLERLAAAAQRFPQGADIFAQGARAFRIAQYFRAGQGLRDGDDGRELRPAALSRTEQVQLKSAFRDIGALIAFTANHYGFKG
jgi:CBS domain-containing protein